MTSIVTFQLPPALPPYTLSNTGTGTYLKGFSPRSATSTSLKNLPSPSTTNMDHLSLKRGDTLEEAIVISDDENEGVTGHNKKKMKTKKTGKLECIGSETNILIFDLGSSHERDDLVSTSNDDDDSDAPLPNWDELDGHHERHPHTLVRRVTSEPQSQHQSPSNPPIGETPAALIGVDTTVDTGHTTGSSTIPNTPTASDCTESPESPQQQSFRQGLDYVQQLTPEQQEQYALPLPFPVEGVSL
jgi:hypothetical protein